METTSTLAEQLDAITEQLSDLNLAEQAAAIPTADYRQLLTIGTQIEALRQAEPGRRELADVYDQLFIVLLEARNIELATGHSPLPIVVSNMI